jgi:DNA replication protein DnaC
MQLHQTMDKIVQLKLFGFQEALKEQLENPQYQDLSFEERIGLLVDKEYLLREEKRLSRRMKEAKLRFQTDVESVDFHSPRGLNKSQFMEFIGGNWIRQRHNLLITGPTGVGKTYLACVLAQKACLNGQRVLFYHFPDLVRDLGIARVDGSYHSLAAKIAKRELLIIDDWLRDPLSPEHSRYVLDLIDSRFRAKSILLTTQLPVADWHSRFKDPTVADAVLDRLVHDSYRIELKGGSMRKKTSKLDAN